MSLAAHILYTILHTVIEVTLASHTEALGQSQVLEELPGDHSLPKSPCGGRVKGEFNDTQYHDPRHTTRFPREWKSSRWSSQLVRLRRQGDGGIRLIIKTSPLLTRQHKVVHIEAFFLAVVVVVWEHAQRDGAGGVGWKSTGMVSSWKCLHQELADIKGHK